MSKPEGDFILGPVVMEQGAMVLYWKRSGLVEHKQQGFSDEVGQK